jgi:hypothetical protein
VEQVVDILFCGDILVSPQIRDPMISGRVLVPLATVERAASVAQRLGSDAPCSDDGAG